MARRRFVHPDFFTDEALVTMPPFTRLLFVGLWCLADREGKLHDKPGKIKMQVFPSDSVDVDAALDALARAGVVTRYAHNGEKYLCVNRFREYQHPHPGEAKSRIPNPPDVNGTRPDVNGTRADCISAGYTEYTEYTRPPNPREPADDVDPTAESPEGWFLRCYPIWYAEERHGARYLPKPARDFPHVQELMQTWPDKTHVERMARLFLSATNIVSAHANRTIEQFVTKYASGCDAKLRGAA